MLLIAGLISRLHQGPMSNNDTPTDAYPTNPRIGRHVSTVHGPSGAARNRPDSREFSMRALRRNACLTQAVALKCNGYRYNQYS